MKLSTKSRGKSVSRRRQSPKVKRLELIHANVRDKASVPSLGGSLYFAIFIDNASRNI